MTKYNIFDNQKIQDLCDSIHAGNVVAGWWTDIKSGESTLATRSRPEMMMLVVSEVSEASGGLFYNLMDDKLPHLPMFAVELADVAIRLFDMIGAEAALLGSHVPYDYLDRFQVARATDFEESYRSNTDQCLMLIVNTISAAMEHYRKGRTQDYVIKLSEALSITFALAELHDIDLFAVIQEKRDFNKNRADHKIENRLKDDGKKF